MLSSHEKFIMYKDLDVNKSLIDQILNLNKMNKNEQKLSLHENDKKLDETTDIKVKSNAIINKSSNDIPLKLAIPPKITQITSVQAYIERLGATTVPFDLFDHVIYSLKNYLKLNIKIEYLYDVENNYHWFAIIKQTYGNLLYLKYLIPKLNSSNNNSKCDANLNESIEADESNQKNEVDNIEDSMVISDREDEEEYEDDDDEIVFDMGDDRDKLYFFYLLNQLKQERIKPIGWCRKNSQKIKIPDFIYEKLKLKYNQNEKIIDKLNFKVANLMTKTNLNVNTSLVGCFFDCLADHNNPPLNLTTKCILQLRVDQILELQDFNMPLNIWFVRILENIGGRLLLEYYFQDSHKSETFWLFYLDTHLHHVRWGKNNNYNYKIPIKYENLVNLNEKVDMIVDLVLNNNNPDRRNLDTVNSNMLVVDLFKHQQKFYTHRFQVGHMIEVLYENKFYVASIVELLNEHYFKVKLHGRETDQVYLYFTPTSQFIFPIKWCEQNLLKLELPNDWHANKYFNWDNYISLCNKRNEMEIKDFYIGADQSLFSSIISRHLTSICEKYKIGSYLECANPMNSNEICVGQIKLRVKHLLFIRIYSSSSSENSTILNVFTQNSFDIFPIGWCEMNNYKNFILPIHFKNPVSKIDVYRFDLGKVPYLARFNGKFILSIDKDYLNFHIYSIFFHIFIFSSPMKIFLYFPYLLFSQVRNLSWKSVSKKEKNKYGK